MYVYEDSGNLMSDLRIHPKAKALAKRTCTLMHMDGNNIHMYMHLTYSGVLTRSIRADVGGGTDVSDSLQRQPVSSHQPNPVHAHMHAHSELHSLVRLEAQIKRRHDGIR
jgi:hypothetical protein